MAHRPTPSDGSALGPLEHEDLGPDPFPGVEAGRTLVAEAAAADEQPVVLEAIDRVHLGDLLAVDRGELHPVERLGRGRLVDFQLTVRLDLPPLRRRNRRRNRASLDLDQDYRCLAKADLRLPAPLEP